MSHEGNKNDELRDRDERQDARRQELRDEAVAETGDVADIGSQDECRKEGDEDH